MNFSNSIDCTCVCVCLSVCVFVYVFPYRLQISRFQFNIVCVSVFNCAVEKLIGNIEMFPTAVIFVAGRTFLRRCQPATKLAPPNIYSTRTHTIDTNEYRIYPDILPTLDTLKYHIEHIVPSEWQLIHIKLNEYWMGCSIYRYSERYFHKTLRNLFASKRKTNWHSFYPLSVLSLFISSRALKTSALNRYHCFHCHSTVMISITLLFAFACFFLLFVPTFSWAKGGQKIIKSIYIVCRRPRLFVFHEDVCSFSASFHQLIPHPLAFFYAWLCCALEWNTLFVLY